MYLNHIFFLFLCRFENNVTKNNASQEPGARSHELIADFDCDVFTQKTPVKRNKAKNSSATILVRNIT